MISVSAEHDVTVKIFDLWDKKCHPVIIFFLNPDGVEHSEESSCIAAGTTIMFTSVFSNIETDSFTQQGENKGPELVDVAPPCAPLRGPTHLSVDPCSLLDLIVFTFKQTVLALWRQSAMTLPGRPG